MPAKPLNRAIMEFGQGKWPDEQPRSSFNEIRDLKTALDEHAIVAITDPQGKIIYVNDKFCAISKYSREELLGQDHRTINSGQHPKEFIRDLWTTILKGKVWKGEICNRTKNGTLYWVDTTIVPFLNDQGISHQFITICADITERKYAENKVDELTGWLAVKTQELKQSNEALEAATEELTFQVEEKGKRADELAVIVEERTAANKELAFQVEEKRKRAEELALVVEERTVANRELAFQVEEKRKRGDALAAIVEFSADAIIGKDLNSIITSWNKGAEKIFGYTASEMVGASIKRLIPADRQDEEQHILGKIMCGENIKHFETLRYAKDGRLIDVSVTVSPIKSATGKVVGVSKVARDITEQVRVNRALEAAHRELAFQVVEKGKRADELAVIVEELTRSSEALERSNVELAQFAYIASHDLQTPLRNISGFVQLLQDNYADKLDEKARDWIHRTVQSTEQMHTLIQDVLEYSRVDSRALPFEPVSLREVFNDAVGLLEASIRDAGGEVTCGELPTMMGDRSQLVQLLQNLIGNGLKYHGEKPPHVHVSAQREGNEWSVSIRDNGIGIASKHYERIFEIFKRLHNQQEYPGTGIGLAVCRRVVHRHGGKIWVESESGHGSTFNFTMPERMAEKL